MKKTIKNIWKIACYPLLFIIAQLVVTVIYMFVLGMIIGVEMVISNEMMSSEEIGELGVERFNLMVATVISAVWISLIVFIIFRKEWQAERFWSFSGLKVPPVLLWVVLGVGLNVITVFILTILPELFTQQPIDGMIGNNLLLEIITIALFMPILEEIIFRGIVQKRLIKIMKLPVALVLQALIFALVHFSFVQGTYAFILGIIVGLVYIWSGSIWSAIIVHVAFNATSVVMTNILGDAEVNMVYLGIAAVAGLAVSIVCMVVLAKKRIVIDNIDMEIEEEVVATENV